VAADTNNSTNRFELDGVEYETPEFTDLTFDDWALVYDECKVVLADFAPIDADAEGAPKNAAELEAARLDRMRNPRLEQAFLMIGYLRVHPDADIETARKLTGNARLIAAIEAVNPDEDKDEPDGDPPTLTSEPVRSFKKSSLDMSESSSSPSEKSSETPAGDPVATTTVG